MKNKKVKGAALLHTIAVFAVVVILLGALLMLAETNIKQTAMQQRSTQAYYAALSGYEVAYAILLMDRSYGAQHEARQSKLLYEYRIRPSEMEDFVEESFLVEATGSTSESYNVIFSISKISGDDLWIRISSRASVENTLTGKITSEIIVDINTETEEIRKFKMSPVYG